MAYVSAPTNVRTVPNALLRIQNRVLVADANFRSLSLPQRLDRTFTAFVAEFRANGWHYFAAPPNVIGDMALKGDPRVPSILEGQLQLGREEGIEFPRAVLLDCARLTSMLATSFRYVACRDDRESMSLGLAAADWGSFVTKKLGLPPANVRGEFSCIDRSVIGNVKRPHEHYATSRQCLFMEHHALRVGAVGLIYDAALVAIYRAPDDVVSCHVVPARPQVNDVFVSRAVAAHGRRLTFTALPAERPSGFTRGFVVREA